MSQVNPTNPKNTATKPDFDEKSKADINNPTWNNFLEANKVTNPRCHIPPNNFPSYLYNPRIPKISHTVQDPRIFNNIPQYSTNYQMTKGPYNPNNLMGRKTFRGETSHSSIDQINFRETNDNQYPEKILNKKLNYHFNTNSLIQNTNYSPSQHFKKNSYSPAYNKLKYWVCSNDLCTYRKNYYNRSNCYMCNTEKSQNAEIIEIDVTSDRRRFVSGNNFYFKTIKGDLQRPIDNRISYNSICKFNSQYEADNKYDRNSVMASQNFCENSNKNNHSNSSPLENKKQDIHENKITNNSHTKGNMDNYSISPCKIIPDKSIIISTYSYAEIEKAVTFLKIVDRIKNKEKLMNMIRNLAAEEDVLLDNDNTTDDQSSDKNCL